MAACRTRKLCTHVQLCHITQSAHERIHFLAPLSVLCSSLLSHKMLHVVQSELFGSHWIDCDTLLIFSACTAHTTVLEQIRLRKYASPNTGGKCAYRLLQTHRVVIQVLYRWYDKGRAVSWSSSTLEAGLPALPNSSSFSRCTCPSSACIFLTICSCNRRDGLQNSAKPGSQIPNTSWPSG